VLTVRKIFADIVGGVPAGFVTLFIISNQNLYMSHAEDRAIFYDKYYSWVDNLFSQTLNLAGYVVKLDWLPENNKTEIIFRLWDFRPDTAYHVDC